MVDALKREFGNVFSFAIGGQISFDVYPIGWDKTYCLQHLIDKNNDMLYDYIYFFGDKTEVGGNDYEIYNHERVNYKYKVNNPDETLMLLKQLQLQL